MRNNLRHRWPKAFEEPEEERQWLSPFQRLEMSPSSSRGEGFLLFGEWTVGNIFNILIKYVPCSCCYLKLKAHGRVCLGAKWTALLLAGAHSCGAGACVSQKRAGHSEPGIYTRVLRQDPNCSRRKVVFLGLPPNKDGVATPSMRVPVTSDLPEKVQSCLHPVDWPSIWPATPLSNSTGFSPYTQ